MIVTWPKILETGEARFYPGSTVAPYGFIWMWQELGVIDRRRRGVSPTFRRNGGRSWRDPHRLHDY